MIPYYFLFIIPAITSFIPLRGTSSVKTLGYFVFASIIIFAMGFRYEVGGDWSTYIFMYQKMRDTSFWTLINTNDPGFMFINWLAFKLGGGIVLVNIISGMFLVYGLINFCSKQPLPWLGLVIAIPFIIIVVGMGYVRQSIALGIIFSAFTNWKDRGFIKFCALIFFASLFHKSALIMLVLTIFKPSKNPQLKWLGVLLSFVLATFYLFYRFYGFGAYQAYIINNVYHSSGALIRLFLNLIPSLIFIFFLKQFKQFKDFKLWLIISVLSIISLFAVNFSSIIVDRLAIYLTPIQIAVYTRIPMLINDRYLATLVTTFIVFLYLIILFVWLNYANNAYSWLPYKIILAK